MFSENTEVRDAVEQLTSRAATPQVAEDMVRELGWYDRYLERGRVDRRLIPRRGNKAGGPSNIAEKAMGSIIKSGSAAIGSVLPPGEKLRPDQRPGVRRHAGQRFHLRHAAAGRRHEPARVHHRAWHTYGLAACPVVKVATRSDLARRWHDLMDLNAGRIADGEISIEQAAGSCSTCCPRWPAAARPGPSGGSCTTPWCCSTLRRSPERWFRAPAPARVASDRHQLADALGRHLAAGAAGDDLAAPITRYSSASSSAKS